MLKTTIYSACEINGLKHGITLNQLIRIAILDVARNDREGIRVKRLCTTIPIKGHS